MEVEPFRIHAPSIMQRLLSDIAKLPAILEKVDLLQSLPCDTVTLQDMAALERQQAKRELAKVLQCLLQWEEHLREHRCNLPSSQVRGRKPNADPSFGFTGLLFANVDTHVWAFQIVRLVETEKVDLFDRGSDEHLDTSTIRGQNNVKLLGLAVKILQSMEYMMGKETRLYSAAASLFPLSTAYRALERDPHRNGGHKVFCWELLDQIRRKGFHTDLILPQMLTSEVLDANV